MSIVSRLRRDADHPMLQLDRWMLENLVKEGAATAGQLIRSRRMQLGPSGENDPALSRRLVRRWLVNARERGLIEAQTVDLDGNALRPPEWVVSDAGRARLGDTRRRDLVPDALAALLGAESGWGEAVDAIAAQDALATAPPPAARTDMPPITRSPGDALSDEEARLNLDKIDHIVVLMMENRSFDQMLGYLDDGRNEVDGIRAAKPNVNDGESFAPLRLVRTQMPKSMDPPHGHSAITAQINDGAMDGFARSFMDATEGADPSMVMGYFTHEELPVYDHLAHNFCVCDRWFSSVPSATWPNRLYALTATSILGREGLFDDGLFFDLPSFVRRLPDQTAKTGWRWYSTDPATLRLVDSRYRLDEQADFHHENFRRVEKYALDGAKPLPDGGLELELGSGFLTDCARNDLPAVSWIDPNFVDLSIIDSTSNDDHPPSDVLAGQDLVLLVYDALASSRLWPRTLLVVVYDEHGGFYDHVGPDDAPERQPQFPTYGVRVPAIVVSPLVDAPTVSKITYDHTSLIRTILERFAPDAIDAMPPRVALAQHLGRLLTGDPHAAGPAPDRSELAALLARRRVEERALMHKQMPGQRPRIQGFPADVIEGGRRLRAKGLPAGHP